MYSTTGAYMRSLIHSRRGGECLLSCAGQCRVTLGQRVSLSSHSQLLANPHRHHHQTPPSPVDGAGAGACCVPAPHTAAHYHTPRQLAAVGRASAGRRNFSSSAAGTLSAASGTWQQCAEDSSSNKNSVSKLDDGESEMVDEMVGDEDCDEAAMLAGDVLTDDGTNNNSSAAAAGADNAGVFSRSVDDTVAHELYAALNCADNSDGQRKIDLVLLEWSYLQLMHMWAPSRLNRRHWIELLKLYSPRQRFQYFRFVCKVELLRERLRQRRREERQQRSQQLDREAAAAALVVDADGNRPPLHYSLSHNSLFLRFYRSHMKLWEEVRAWSAMVHGPRLVFDLGWESAMTRREVKNMVSQVVMSFGAVMAHERPFDVHLCNVQRGTYQHESLLRVVPSLEEPTYPLHVHSQSYLDLFDRDRLVYLSPHSVVDLHEYDEDDVYIIGGLVDLGCSVKHSLARAKREGIRTARFPLKKYLKMSSGFSSSLTLVNVTSIMLALASGHSWPQALESVPRRGLAPDNELQHVSERISERRKVTRCMAEKNWMFSSHLHQS